MDAFTRRFHLVSVATEFLPHTDRYRILQVSSPNLDDVVELRSLAFQRCAELPHSRQQPGDQGLCNSDVHGGGDHVVARLPSIHVIIGAGAGEMASALTCSSV